MSFKNLSLYEDKGEREREKWNFLLHALLVTQEWKRVNNDLIFSSTLCTQDVFLSFLRFSCFWCSSFPSSSSCFDWEKRTERALTSLIHRLCMQLKVEWQKSIVTLLHLSCKKSSLKKERYEWMSEWTVRSEDLVRRQDEELLPLLLSRKTESKAKENDEVEGQRNEMDWMESKKEWTRNGIEVREKTSASQKQEKLYQGIQVQRRRRIFFILKKN